MRFERVHLKAFGAFVNRELDFSGGHKGLHLVHGPNEAGKSTVLRAITQLLYGIETRTSDDFVHPMKNLRVGATLVHGGTRLCFYRRKGNKNTLLDGEDRQALPDDALSGFLSGVDAVSFRNFFGLSHDQLVRGGQALVQGEGDVGQALFSAAAGMGDLRALLERLEAGANELFSPKASKPRINTALSQVIALRKAIKETQVASKDWQERDTALRQAEQDRGALDTDLRAARAEAARLRRLRDALPRVVQRSAQLEKLAPLRSTPRLPEDFAERRQRCLTDAAGAETAGEAARQARALLEQELETITVDELLLAHEEAIEALNERRAQNQKAIADRDRSLAPLLQRLEEVAERTLHHLRPHWTLDQAPDLRLAPGQQQRIHELAKLGEKRLVERDHAESLLKKGERERAQLVDALREGAVVADSQAVEFVLKQAVPLAGAETILAEHRRRAATLRESINGGIQRLGLSAMTLAQVEALPVPVPATIDHFRVALEDARKAVAASETTIAALSGTLRDLEARHALETRTHLLPSHQDLEDLRRHRDLGWQHARSAWETGIPPAAVNDPAAMAWLEDARQAHPESKTLADAFTSAIEAADLTADRLRNEASRVAEQAQREAQLDQTRTALEQARQTLRAQTASLTAMEAEWSALWSPTGIMARTPREMAEWRHSLTELLEAIQDYRESESAAEVLDARLAEVQSALSAALAAAGEHISFTTLSQGVSVAESWLSAQHTARDTRVQLERRLDELNVSKIPEAREARDNADDALRTWRAEWTVLAEDLGAPGTASSGEVLALVETIGTLLGQCEEIAEKRARIAAIDADDDAFQTDVRALVADLGRDPSDGDAHALVQALYASLKPCRAARQRRDELQRRWEEQGELLRAAETAQARVAAEMRQLCAEAGVATPDALAAAERASSERRRLEVALEELDQQLAALSGSGGVEALVAEVAEVDGDTLASDLKDLDARIEGLDLERLQKQETIGDLRAELRRMDGSDHAAQMESEAQRLLAGVADDAESYARLRIAGFVLRRAIEQYREANQEPLLARAGALFHTMTLGSFCGLRAEVDDRDQHVLHGLRPGDVPPVPVSGMSEGTADQLYLALRLASLERHLERHAPLPLILDDILVNFDDERAAATLRVLADLSDRTQIIYFTHHRHLVDLARDCVAPDRLFVQALTA
jgi:uncharacterized protein YhaN